MEGVLFVRRRRSKLLRRWQKRYVVLTSDGVLREYAEATTQSQSASAIAGSGMSLKQECSVRGARVVALPFPLVGRPHAFRVKKKKGVRVTLAAKSNEQMLQWIKTLKSVCGEQEVLSRGERNRSPAISGRVNGLFGAIPRSLRPMELPTALPRSSEQEFVDLQVHRGDDLTRLLLISEWCSHRLRTKVDWSVAGVSMLRGSMVVAVNGISLQTLSEDEVHAMLRPARAPVMLRWLKSPYKRGSLKCKLCFGLTTQLKTIAMYRNGLHAWKEQLVEIDGDVLTCQVKKSDGREANSSVIPLVGGCTVKTVHEVVADQKFCFLVSVKAYSMLFQATSAEEMLQWTDAIQRAINIAEGCIPGFDLALDALQLESSVNMRSRGSLLSDSWPAEAGVANDSASESSDDDSDDVDSGEDDDSETTSPVYPAPEVVRRESEFPDDQLSGMLEFLQVRGRFIEALQFMASQSTQRAAYWKAIFRWAIDPLEQEDLQRMLAQPLNASDAIQVQKDVPRTSKWLAGSPGSPELDETATKARLQALNAVLHAFLVSCDADIRTDARSKSSMDLADSKSFYMQGMNGIAFIILEVVQDDELLGLQLLRGVIAHILPHVFGIRSAHAGGDNFDLFSSLMEVGNVLQEVVQMHLPNFHDAMEEAGLPVCLLAYKWFPTLFSDISLMAHRSQMRFDTLLAIWDVCLLMGIEGMFCVALALFSAAEEEVVSLRKGASTELVTGTIVTVLSSIEPRDLMISVCEVIELCSHPVLLKLRNGHRRRLQLVHETKPKEATRLHGQTDGPIHADASTKTEGSDAEVTAATTPVAMTVVAAAATAAPSVAKSDVGGAVMTVRDLDSGKMFRISNTGNMLLAVKPSATTGVSQ